ncbi:MAG: methyltransferase domain-containing protein [Clostridia bacterium]|nr:methyltransferase domain-containing protein [Clostridia bacterium]
MNFTCPVCREALAEEEKLYRCEKGHCYDKSKFGYVNLLQSQKSSAKRHGDDRVMIRARRDFLDKGYYGFLRDALYENCNEFLQSGASVIDAGCGECWYSSGIKQKLNENVKKISFYGVDISKDALEFASKRKSGIPAAVASVFDLPFNDCCADLLLNVFSPEADSEYLRVLKKDGIMIRVIPLEKHLFELKAAVYEKPYLNDVPETNVVGFTLIRTQKIRKAIELGSNEDIQNLFKMTPYYYKTSKNDQSKLDSLDRLKTQAEFEIRVYRKD